MQSTPDHLDLAPPQQGRWTGPTTLALIVHGLLIAALTWGVSWKKDAPEAAFEAEIWSRLPQQAAPRAVEPPPPPPPEPEPEPEPTPTPPPPPPPAPAPAPPPPPPGPTEAQIAVQQAKKKAEAEKRAQEEATRKAAAEKAAAEKRAQEQKARQEREAKARAEAQKKAQEEKARKEREARQLAERQARERQQAEAAQQRARDEQLRRMMGQAGASGGPQSTGTAAQSSGPSSSYAGRVAARIRPNVVFTEPIAGNPRAEIEIRTLPDGTITSSRLVKSSGNRAWDEAAIRAIERTGTLPRDTDGRVPGSLIIGLRPLD